MARSNGGTGSLLPAEGNPFFVAERVDGGGGSVPVGRGSMVLIPHAAGAVSLSGLVEGVRCLPAA